MLYFDNTDDISTPSEASISRLGVADGVVSPVVGEATSSDDLAVSVDGTILIAFDFSSGVTASDVALKPISFRARSCIFIFSTAGEPIFEVVSFSRFVTAGATGED